MKHTSIFLLSFIYLFFPDISCVKQEISNCTQIIQEHKTTIEQTYPTLFAQQELANDLVEKAFTGQSAEVFLQMHTDTTQHSQLQFWYTAMWSILAEQGWCTWHEACLKELKREHDAGKTIVYLGGGCDIYQLITHGIYNIIVIDPLLPTQKDYYPDDYLYLIKGLLNDQITGLAGKNKLTLKRTGFKETDRFMSYSLPSGQQCCIPGSRTEWALLNAKQDRVGTIIFDRRIATQKDFEPDKNKILLLSWNELHFVINGEWGVQHHLFQEDLSPFIKQLKKPITKAMINNMHRANQLNKSHFKFIGLGSHVFLKNLT